MPKEGEDLLDKIISVCRSKSYVSPKKLTALGVDLCNKFLNSVKIDDNTRRRLQRCMFGRGWVQEFLDWHKNALANVPRCVEHIRFAAFNALIMVTLLHKLLWIKRSTTLQTVIKFII